MEVEREIVLDAPPEEVWEALTDPEQLEQWFANEVEFDVDRGGIFRWDDGDVRHAAVEEADPQRRLAIRWWDPAGGDESEVVFTLVAMPTGTRLLVTETASCDWAWGLQAFSRAWRNNAAPPGRAGRRAAASSVAPVASGYEHSLRPCIALTHHALSREQHSANPSHAGRQRLLSAV